MAIRISIIILFVLIIFSSNGQILKDMKKYAEGKAKQITSKENLSKFGNRALDDMGKARDQFDSTDFDYAILLNENAGLFDVKERGEVKSKVTTVLSIGSSYMNDEVTDEEKARLNLEKGEFAYASGWYKAAGARFDQAKELYEAAGLTSSIGYTKTLSDQGLLYATMGRYTQAEEATLTALNLRRELFGESNLGVAASLNNYGVLHHNQAHYHEAEKELDNALHVIEYNNTQSTMPHAIVLNNKAMVYQTIGRYDEAEKILQRAIQIAEGLQSSKSKNHLKFVSNLALLYQQTNKYTEAEALYLNIRKKLSKKSLDYANVQHNLAAVYVAMHKDNQIEELLKSAAAIYKSSLGESSPAYANVISDLGNFYRYKSNYQLAEDYLNEAFVIRENVLGEQHPHYVKSKEDLAVLYWKKLDLKKAASLYVEVMKQSLDFVNRYFPPMSEAEKSKYWDVLSPRFERFKNFAVDAYNSEPQLLTELYEMQMVTKALLLNSTNKVKKTILASGDKPLIKDYLAWIDQKEKLARLYGYSKQQLEEQSIDLDSAERVTNDLERSLSSRSSEFSKGYQVEKVEWKKVQTLLTDSEAIIEIIRFNVFEQAFTDEVKYLALILSRQSTQPRVVVLDNGSQLETRYAKFYKNAVTQQIEDGYSYEQYWSRIEPLVKGKQTIYLVPDGVYNQVNLNTIKSSDGKYFIQQFDLVLMGNSKDLFNLKKKAGAKANKDVVLIGFPDYGTGNISPLPGTKVELESVSKLLKGAGFKVSQYSQQTASEGNLKKIKSPAMLHIATHGYFLQDVGNENRSVFGVHLDNASDNPLLRSGLLLANAATASNEPDLQSNDNGVLTAYEAMNLDLEGTDLIVLSACETGLGDVRAGEGVYGLQRALQVAGARTLIMSLWKVDDIATVELMKNFYANYVKTGNKQRAFKAAQQQLMIKYPQPYYWGAFMMIGG